MSVSEAISGAVDRDRLVATASDLVGIPRPTGREGEAAAYVAGVLADIGLDATLQPVEDGR